jgi:putative membrane protein
MNKLIGIPRLALPAALVILALALALPALPQAAGYLFSARMLQHLLLQLVVPALFLLGLPPLKPPPLPWLLKRPLATWCLGLGAMWFWHAPLLCNATVRSPWLQGVECFSLLLLGAAFWSPIAGPWTALRLPPLMGIVYLFTACFGCTVLGILTTFAPPGLYLAGPSLLNEWQFAAPSDQRVGGLLMWVPACLIYLTGILGLLARWYGMPEAAPLPNYPTGALEEIT